MAHWPGVHAAQSRPRPARSSRLPSRLSPPAYQRQPAPPGQSRAPLIKETGQLGQTRSDIIAFAAPAPVHRTVGRCTLHPGPGPRGVSVGGPRHPAASRTDTFMRPGAAPSWPFCFCAGVLWRPRTFSGLSPVRVPGVCPSAEGQTAVCSDVRPEGYPARACRAVVPWAMQWGRCTDNYLCAARWPVGDCAARQRSPYWYIALAHVRMCVLLGAMLCYVVRYCYAMWWGQIIRSAVQARWCPVIPR